MFLGKTECILFGSCRILKHVNKFEVHYEGKQSHRKKHCSALVVCNFDSCCQSWFTRLSDLQKHFNIVDFIISEIFFLFAIMSYPYTQNILLSNGSNLCQTSLISLRFFSLSMSHSIAAFSIRGTQRPKLVC